MRGELDFRASFKERLALLQGLSEDVLEEIGASLRLTEGAETLFAELKRLGYKTAILSGGFTYFARQLQAKLGIDYVFANELQIVDGKVTGVAVEPIVDAQRKADLLRELAAKEGLSLEQTIAVGDGANDPADARPGRPGRGVPRQAAGQAVGQAGDLDPGPGRHPLPARLPRPRRTSLRPAGVSCRPGSHEPGR